MGPRSSPEKTAPSGRIKDGLERERRKSNVHYHLQSWLDIYCLHGLTSAEKITDATQQLNEKLTKEARENPDYYRPIGGITGAC